MFDQVQAPYPPPPPFLLLVPDTPMYDVQCLTPCKIIILGDKLSPNDSPTSEGFFMVKKAQFLGDLQQLPGSLGLLFGGHLV